MLRFKQWLQEGNEYYTDIGHKEPYPRILWVWTGEKLIVKRIKAEDKRGNVHDYVFSTKSYSYQGRYSKLNNIVSIVNVGKNDPKKRIPTELRSALTKRFPGALLKGFGNVRI